MRPVIHAWMFTNPRGHAFIYAQIGQEPNHYMMTIGPGGNRAAEAFLRAFQRDDLLTEEDADRARLKAEGVTPKKSRAKGRQNFTFYATCDTWPLDVDSLKRMIYRAKEISRKDFLGHVDPEEMEELERQLGYAQHPRNGLVMSADRNVEYYRSSLNDCSCVYLLWSGIEHVFVDPSCRP